MISLSALQLSYARQVTEMTLAVILRGSMGMFSDTAEVSFEY